MSNWWDGLPELPDTSHIKYDYGNTQKVKPHHGSKTYVKKDTGRLLSGNQLIGIHISQIEKPKKTKTKGKGKGKGKPKAPVRQKSSDSL